MEVHELSDGSSRGFVKAFLSKTKFNVRYQPQIAQLTTSREDDKTGITYI